MNLWLSSLVLWGYVMLLPGTVWLTSCIGSHNNFVLKVRRHQSLKQERLCIAETPQLTDTQRALIDAIYFGSCHQSLPFAADHVRSEVLLIIIPGIDFLEPWMVNAECNGKWGGRSCCSFLFLWCQLSSNGSEDGIIWWNAGMAPKDCFVESLPIDRKLPLGPKLLHYITLFFWIDCPDSIIIFFILQN